MLIEILVAATVALLAAWVVEAITDYITSCWELGGFGRRYSDDYEDYDFELTDEDERILENNVEILKEFFPDGIPERMRKLNAEERLELFAQLSERMALSYGLGDDCFKGIKFECIESEDENILTRGYYDFDEKFITINANFLLFDLVNKNFTNQAVIDDVLTHNVVTLMHELRHAYQGQAITYGGDDRAKIWENNLQNYIGCNENFERYIGQPIEVDARCFSEMCMDKYLRGDKQ